MHQDKKMISLNWNKRTGLRGDGKDAEKGKFHILDIL